MNAVIPISPEACRELVRILEYDLRMEIEQHEKRNDREIARREAMIAYLNDQLKGRSEPSFPHGRHQA